MATFQSADAAGKDFLLPVAEDALREFERSLRAYDEDGGQLFEVRLETGIEGIRRSLMEVAALVSTPQAAFEMRAEVTFFEAAFLANGISPILVQRPTRYEN